MSDLTSDDAGRPRREQLTGGGCRRNRDGRRVVRIERNRVSSHRPSCQACRLRGDHGDEGLRQTSAKRAAGMVQARSPVTTIGHRCRDSAGPAPGRPAVVRPVLSGIIGTIGAEKPSADAAYAAADRYVGRARHGIIGRLTGGGGDENWAEGLIECCRRLVRRVPRA